MNQGSEAADGKYPELLGSKWKKGRLVPFLSVGPEGTLIQNTEQYPIHWQDYR